MEVIHRLALNLTESDVAELGQLGITVRGGFAGFDVSESSAIWPAVRDWIARRHPSDIERAIFSPRELDSAQWLAMRSDGQAGYPQPDPSEFGYRELTYDTSEFCEQCGIGLRQKAAFRLDKEPGLRRTSIRQLNWVVDEFFITPEIWEVVFQPRGVAQREVLNLRGERLRTIVQLYVQDTVGLETSSLAPEQCPRCDRIKYVALARGPLPPLRDQPTATLVKTDEWFGSGGSAYREVLVSQSLRQALRAEGMRGVHYVPVQDAAG